MVREVQEEICRALEERDRERVREDAWEASAGGGGWSRVLQDGSVLEKGGVNV
ncbi:MAG: coproporphyrinogen III oxidase, partial [Thermoanaerobaculia bacterium]|nr:coproporphyrinogen III oxidase [Thermoanaerobaculia bacterium]